MTISEAISKFEMRLDEEYLSEFKNGTLFTPGRFLWSENLNKVSQVEIVRYENGNVWVNYPNEKANEQWTLDNFYVFNRKHTAVLFDNAVPYGLYSEDKWKKEFIQSSGIYILHNISMPVDKGYYVGKSDNKDGISARLFDHIHNSSGQRIDKFIEEGTEFSLRIIELASSGYSNTNALEGAMIAYLESWDKWNKNNVSYKFGYNQTRGNNVAGNQCKTGSLIVK